MPLTFDCTESAGRRRGIERAAIAVAGGELVALPVEAVYAIGCDPFSENGIAALRTLKGQASTFAPPVMIAHPRTLDGITTGLSAAARSLAAAFWPGLLTLICRAQPTLKWDLAGSGSVAVRIPLHPVALELLDRTGPMAVTGANLPGSSRQPISGAEVRENFGEGVQVYLNIGHLSGDGPAGAGPSSVVDVTGEHPRLLRPGAVSETALREVVPDLLTQDG